MPSIKLPCGEWGWADHQQGDRLIHCPVHEHESFVVRAKEIRTIAYEVQQPKEKKK